jgi:hypothetical protein
MMDGLHTVYKIKSVSHKDGTKKDISESWMRYRYHLDAVMTGRSAILSIVDKDMHGEALHTSIVEDIFIFGDKVRLITTNTIYWLEPRIEGV